MSSGGPYAGADLVAVLPVADLDRAESWYGRVGFEVTHTFADYRILRAGHLVIHLRLAEPHEVGGSSAGVHVTLPDADAVDMIHAAWTAAGSGVLTAPILHPHGLVEFAAEDPDGNLWRIGARSSEPADLVEPGDDPDGSDRGETTDRPVDDTESGVTEIDEPDWLAVVATGRCPICDATPSDGPASTLAERFRDDAYRWRVLLRDADDEAVRARSRPGAWSALEYGVHVRDVLAVFTERVLRTLAETNHELGWWDHEAAMADGFANESDREAVADDLAENAGRLAEVLASVSGDRWERTATRGLHDHFTVELLARYSLHELVHHRIDAERTLGSAQDR